MWGTSTAMNRGTRTTIVASPSGRKHITVLIWVRNVKYMGTGEMRTLGQMGAMENGHFKQMGS